MDLDSPGAAAAAAAAAPAPKLTRPGDISDAELGAALIVQKLENGYEIRIIDLDSIPNIRMRNYLQQNFAQKVTSYCRGTILASSMRWRFPNLTFLMELSKPGPGRTRERIAMSGLETREVAGLKVLYVEVICGKPGAGGVLLKAINEYAKENGYDAVSLSSLAYVLAYYSRPEFGFRPVADPRVHTSHAAKEALEKLRKFRFKSEYEFDKTYLVGSAARTAVDNGSFVRNLNEVFKPQFAFFLEPDGKITVADMWAGQRDKELETMTEDASKNPANYIGVVDAILALRKEGLAVDGSPIPVGRRHVTQEYGGSRMPIGTMEGFTMYLSLTPAASPPAAGGARRRRTRRGKSRHRKRTQRARRRRPAKAQSSRGCTMRRKGGSSYSSWRNSGPTTIKRKLASSRLVDHHHIRIHCPQCRAQN